MKRKKIIYRILVASAILAAIGLGGMYFFRKPDLWRLIPPGVYAVVEWPEKKDLPQDSVAEGWIWADAIWQSYPEIAADWRFFTSLFAKTGWRGQGRAMTIITTGLDNNELALVFILENQQRQTAATLLSDAPFATSKYRGIEILRTTYPEATSEKPNFAIAFTKGLILLARDPIHLEEIAAQLARKPVYTSPPTGPETQNDPYSLVLLPPGMKMLTAGLPGQSFGIWAEETTACLRIGKPEFTDTTFLFRGAATGMKPLKSPGPKPDGMFWSLAPGHTAWFCRLRQPAFRSFKGAGLFERFLLPRAEQEIALIALERILPMQDPALNLAIRFKNQNAAEKSLTELAAETGIAERRTYLNHTLQRIVAGALFSPLGLSRHFNNPWVTVMGDYLVFSENAIDLEQWIDRSIVGDVLAAQTWALEMERPEDVLTWLCDSGRLGTSTGLIQNLLKPGPFALHITAKGSNWEGFGQWKAHRPQPAANLVFQAQFPGEIAGPPAFAVDGQGKSRFLVQDVNWNLYALDENGQTLWTRQLDGPILGQPQFLVGPQGKNGWVWNTARQLFFTGFDGIPAPGWPQELAAEASAGVTAYYSEALLDHFFFLPSVTGAVYAYRSGGEPVPGWSPKTGVGIVRRPVTHLRFDNMDYFTLLNDQGNLMVFGLDGAPRFPALGLGKGINQVIAGQVIPGDHRLVFGDSSGQVTVVRPGGENFRLAIQVGENKNVRLAFADVVGDKRMDYLGLEAAELSVYSYSEQGFTRQFNKKYPFRPDTVWTIRSELLDRSFIGLQDRNREQIWLLDETGRVLPGYPLAGKFPFVPAESPKMATPLLLSVSGRRLYGYILRSP